MEKAYEIKTTTDKRGWMRLQFLTDMPHQKLRVTLVMEPCLDEVSAESSKIWTLEELQSLPAEERTLILEDIAAKAEIIYRTSPELMEFEEAELYEVDEAVER